MNTGQFSTIPTFSVEWEANLVGNIALSCVFLIVSLLSPGKASGESFEQALVAAALARTHHAVRYDGSYISIAYPGGDVPAHTGVCTDVIIRAYRTVGVDLQRLVHEDMREHFEDYPSRRIWGQNGPDPNIDHRRVPNLQTFFTRNGQVLPITFKAGDYLPGDIVTWMLPGNLPHIGIVADKLGPSSAAPLIVHNIGAGPKLEDMLFTYPVSGHYRYVPNDWGN